MRSYWISMIPVIGFPIRRQKFGQKDIQGKCHVMTKAEIGIIHLQVKEHQGL